MHIEYSNQVEGLTFHQFQAHGAYGFWPASAEGDDIVVSAEWGDLRVPMLRQQTTKPTGRPNRPSLREETS